VRTFWPSTGVPERNTGLFSLSWEFPPKWVPKLEPVSSDIAVVHHPQPTQFSTIVLYMRKPNTWLMLIISLLPYLALASPKLLSSSFPQPSPINMSGDDVLLYQYDLTKGLATGLFQMFLGKRVEGAEKNPANPFRNSCVPLSLSLLIPTPQLTHTAPPSYCLPQASGTRAWLCGDRSTSSRRGYSGRARGPPPTGRQIRLSTWARRRCRTR
jgi:hypothetical protein